MLMLSENEKNYHVDWGDFSLIRYSINKVFVGIFFGNSA